MNAPETLPPRLVPAWRDASFLQALGPAFGTAPATSAVELPAEATIEAAIEPRVRKLYPYYY